MLVYLVSTWYGTASSSKAKIPRMNLKHPILKALINVHHGNPAMRSLIVVVICGGDRVGRRYIDPSQW